MKINRHSWSLSNLIKINRHSRSLSNLMTINRHSWSLSNLIKINRHSRSLSRRDKNSFQWEYKQLKSHIRRHDTVISCVLIVLNSVSLQINVRTITITHLKQFESDLSRTSFKINNYIYTQWLYFKCFFYIYHNTRLKASMYNKETYIIDSSAFNISNTSCLIFQKPE